MANVNRVRAAFEGFPGGPGVSTFYCLNPEAFLPVLRGWLQDFAGYLPLTVGVQVEATGDIIDSISGVLTGTWNAALPERVNGAATGSYAAPAGVCVNWLTGTVLDGHRLRGRTFMVPLGGSTFDGDGTLNAVALAGIRLSSSNFVTAAAANLVVWHRPILAGTLNAAGQPVAPRAGGHAVVTSSRVLDKVAVLRSRRD